MNDAVGSLIERQADAMLRLIRRHQAAAAGDILDQAHAVTRERLRAARANARRRVHEAATGLRGEVEIRLTRLRAGEQAEDRRNRLARDALALDEGRALLREALAARWRDAGSRRRWCTSVIEDAARVLPKGQWELAYPANWSDEERDETLRTATEAAGECPVPTPAEDIEAGLRVAIGDAVLDGTVEGLLARAAELDARLLAAFHEHLDPAVAEARG